MMHYLIEVALWILLAYVVGCAIGYLLRRLFGSNEVPAMAMAQPAAAPERTVEASTPALEAVLTPVVTEEPAVAQLMARMERPRGLDAPRDGKPDDLQRISGIGPKNEKILHTLGFFHFDQIAVWSEEHVAWVDDHLKFNGRIGRERWIEQSQLLASGREEEFTELFGSGGLKNAKGESQSGTRTRKS